MTEPTVHHSEPTVHHQCEHRRRPLRVKLRILLDTGRQQLLFDCPVCGMDATVTTDDAAPGDDWTGFIALCWRRRTWRGKLLIVASTALGIAVGALHPPANHGMLAAAFWFGDLLIMGFGTFFAALWATS